MYDFLEYLHRYCIKSIENWKAVPNLSCEIERGNIVESTEAMIGYHVIVKQKKVIIYDNDIASISNISGNYIAADLLALTPVGVSKVISPALETVLATVPSDLE